MAALVIMQLVEQRLIDLDAPVVRYEPQFVMADDETREITMRQLLSMSAACEERTRRQSGHSGYEYAEDGVNLAGVIAGRSRGGSAVRR
jgi:CubicO group peptidase (beta-lactamase class C family)